MKLTQDIIRKMIQEEISGGISEVSDPELEQNAVTQISNLLVRLESEGLNAQQILNKAKQAFDAAEQSADALDEAGTYDHEDDMAKRQMYKTARDATQVLSMIRPGENYPAWLQSKIRS